MNVFNSPQRNDFAIKPVPENSPRPFWSVMIPVANRLTYLRQTLDSVLTQAPGVEQMQICIVDNTTEVIDWRSWLTPAEADRLEIYKQPTRLSMQENWNTCINLARGHWVHILHDDDYVLPGFYESLRSGIEAHPGAGAALCRHAYCDENGHWHRLSILERTSPGLLQDFIEPLVTAEHIQCAAIAVRRSAYEELGGFNPDLKHALDWEMWVRIAGKFPFFYEPKILACWRNHSGATTSRQIRSGENIRDINKAISIWSRYLPNGDGQRLAAAARDHFAHEGLYMAGRLLAQNDIEACLNQVSAALSCKNSLRLRWQASKIQVKATAKKLAKGWRTSASPS